MAARTAMLALLSVGLLGYAGAASAAAVADAEAAGTCSGEAGCQMRADDPQVRGSALLQRRVASASMASGLAAGGAPWTEQEALIIMAKIHAIALEPWQPVRWSHRLHEMFECYTQAPGTTGTNPSIVPCTHVRNAYFSFGVEPTMPMLLRLGFHDCIKYKDGSGGCDGCMNFKNMFLRFITPGQGRGSRPDNPAGGNANMAMLGDLLELIYTDPKFPDFAPVLGQSTEYPDGRSMKDLGMSRADLWAFATLVAAHKGFEQNNMQCLAGQALYSTMDVGFPCKISLARPLTFYTGRADCPESIKPDPWQCNASCFEDRGVEGPADPDCKAGFIPCSRDATCARDSCKGCDYCQPAVDGTHRPRAYESSLEEAGPKSTFNGSMVADFFKDGFGFSKRKTVAILGAHSFGQYHGEVSGGFRYDWTNEQADQLNNVYYRIISLMPAKHFELYPDWGIPHAAASVGGVGGQLANSSFFLHKDNKELGGGHFQWFHKYDRCPFCVDGLNLDRHQNIWGYPVDRCCALCAKATRATVVSRDAKYMPTAYELEGLNESEKAEFLSHRCLQPVAVHETAFNVDVGLHRKMNVDAGGCPLSAASQQFPHGFLKPEDPTNDLKDADDDLNMHQIVELFAREQNAWADAFVSTLEEMLTNGVTGELVESLALGSDVSCKARGRTPWECTKGRGASCTNYRCPFGYVAKAGPDLLTCDVTLNASGEALCSTEECCDAAAAPGEVKPHSAPAGFTHLGRGVCTVDALMVKGASSIEACAGFCDGQEHCAYVSFKKGQCAMFTKFSNCTDGYRYHYPYESFAKDGAVRPGAQGYEYVGVGLCSAGHIAWSAGAEKTNVELCAAKCTSNPACRFFGFWQGKMCRQYGERAGECTDRNYAGADFRYVTFRRSA